MIEPDLTLTAGPTTVGPGVLAALGRPVLYHYDPAFLDWFRRAETAAAQVLDTSGQVILLMGEAILGLEAATRSLVRQGMPVLNLVSGPFGKGMGYWLKEYGAVLREIEVPYNDSVDPDEVARALDQHPETELVCLVHSETPSGTLNDCSRIGPIARERGILTLVDCVSSVGGMPFHADAWNLDVAVTGPQKCLGGTPGISVVCVSEQAWAAIKRNPAAPRNSYLSLLDWHEQWHGHGRFPYTPSVSEIYALEAACAGVLEEGLGASWARHETAALACRAGVLAMGLRLWPARQEIASTCVTAVTMPGGLSDEAVRARVRARYGVMISAGHGAGNLLRIGHMGPTANGAYVTAGLAALGRAFADLGVPVQVGAGIEAALAVLSERQRNGEAS